MGTGRKRIDIRPIVDESKRRVTFSKRRQGLFKKLERLRNLTGCPAFSVVFSASGRPFAFGDPKLARQFLVCSDGGGDWDEIAFEDGGGDGNWDLDEMKAEMNKLEEMRRRLVERRLHYVPHQLYDVDDQQSHITVDYN